MTRLIVSPDSPDAWEIPLEPGTVTFGRDEDNDFCLDDSSVSSRHCQVTMSPSGVMVKDLDSVGGTYVDETLVEEARLASGQTLRVGDFVIRFESDSPPVVASAPAVPPQPVIAEASCKIHPKAAAIFQCEKCGSALCGLCVSTRIMDGQMGQFCRACGGECAALQPEVIGDAPPFLKAMAGVFTYPFNEDGVILLVTGTVFYLVLNFVSSHAAIPGLILGLLGTGYLLTYLQLILRASANGEDRMPDWPDVSDWSELISPVFQAYGTLIISFAPLFLLRIFVPAEADWRVWASLAALLWGCLYFPMSFLAVTMFDTIGGVNPMLIVPSIVRIFGEYLLAMALLLLPLVVIHFVGNDLSDADLMVQITARIILEFAGLYLLIIEMRILGMLYWTKKDKLRWFRH